MPHTLRQGANGALNNLGECSTFVLMEVETLGVASSLGWKVHMRCVYRKALRWRCQTARYIGATQGRAAGQFPAAVFVCTYGDGLFGRAIAPRRRPWPHLPIARRRWATI